MFLNFMNWCNVVLHPIVIEVISTCDLENKHFLIWNISKPGCKSDNEWQQTNITITAFFKRKITLEIK